MRVLLETKKAAARVRRGENFRFQPSVRGDTGGESLADRGGRLLWRIGNSRRTVAAPTLALRRWSTVTMTMAVGAIALLLVLGSVKVLQADGYKALYDGRWIAQHGIPHREGLTVAARGRGWIDEQWLAELVYYEAWRLGGYALVAILGALAIASAYMILAAVLLRRGMSVMATTWLSIFAIIVALGWVFTRAQNLALPLFALLLALCLSDAERDRPSWRLILVLPLLAVWANVHGSVVLGAGLASLYLLQRAGRLAVQRSRKLAIGYLAIAVAALLTPLATPYGTHILHYYGEFVGNKPMAAATAEWDPPRIPTADFFELYGSLVLLLILSIRAARKGRYPSPVLVGAVLITAAVAAREIGSIVWFGMTSAIMFAEVAGTRSAHRNATPAGVVSMAATALGVSAIVLAALTAQSARQYQAVVPLRVLASTAAYAESHPCARLLADNWDASALLWLYPSLSNRIGFDARLEQYSRPALSRWLDFEYGSASGWLRTTTGYQILLGNSKYTPSLVRRLASLNAASPIGRDRRGIAVATGESNPRCD